MTNATDNQTTKMEQEHMDDEIVYGFQFCGKPDSTMLGETMFDYDGEPVGWIVANGVKRGNAITDNRMTDNQTTEKPVSGMRVWGIEYVKSDCPHCGWDDNRTKADELWHDEIWESYPYIQKCEMCGKEYKVMVDDDDR